MAKNASGNSVISAEYKAVHELDELGARLSEAVRGIDGRSDAERLRALAVSNGCWEDGYAELNLGMQRMNIGNRLRGKVRRGEGIVWPDY